MSSPSPQPLSPNGRGANPARGEAALVVGGESLRLRPSFEALVAAEEELGPLFGLVERAAGGQLRLAETVALFWHCVESRPEGLTRERLGAAVAEGGLARATPVLKLLLTQILQGSNSPLPGERGRG
jgi:Phage tail tube protein, GTA-gp10